MKKILLSYGGGPRFKESIRMLQKEAIDLNFFDEINMHTEESIYELSEYKGALLLNQFSEIISHANHRGCLSPRTKFNIHYLLKPLAVYNQLKKIKQDDILYYVDAGCSTPTLLGSKETIKALTKQKDMVSEHASGALGFYLGKKESAYTKGDIFKHFKCSEDKAIYDTHQFTSSKLVLKKCKKSLEIAKKWWETSKYFADLCTDSESKTKNFSDFVANRHDQSLLSVILKINSCEKLSDSIKNNGFRMSRRRQ